MIENTLCYGGTPTMTNRAREMAYDTGIAVCDPLLVEDMTKEISDAVVINEIRWLLEDMATLNINFVGSRGYTYMAERMLDNLDRDVERGRVAEPSIYTRSCGLREKILELLP